MRRASRARATLAVVSAALVLIAACGGDNTEPTSDQDESPSETGEKEVSGKIRVITFAAAPPASTIMESVVADFNVEYPDVEVELITVPGGEYDNKLTTMLAAGDNPDVIHLGPFTANTYYENGAILNLQELIDVEEGMLNDLNESALANFRVGGDSEGDVIALPESWAPYAVFYNREMFEAAGIEEPTTTYENDPDQWNFDYFQEIAEQLTLDTDADGTTDQFGAQIQFWWTGLIPWMWSFGGDFLNQDATESVIFSEENIEMLNYVQTFVHDLGYAPTAEEVEQFRGLEEGKAAMTWTIALHEGNFQAADLDYGIAPPLKGPGGRFSPMNGNGLGIHPDTENLDAAWAFLKFRVGEEVQRRIYDEFAYLPVSESALASVEIDPAYREALKNVKAYPAQKTSEWPRLSAVVAQHWQSFVNTDATSVEDGLQTIADEVDRILK